MLQRLTAAGATVHLEGTSPGRAFTENPPIKSSHRYRLTTIVFFIKSRRFCFTVLGYRRLLRDALAVLFVKLHSLLLLRLSPCWLAAPSGLWDKNRFGRRERGWLCERKCLCAGLGGGGHERRGSHTQTYTGTQTQHTHTNKRGHSVRYCNQKSHICDRLTWQWNTHF